MCICVFNAPGILIGKNNRERRARKKKTLFERGRFSRRAERAQIDLRISISSNKYNKSVNFIHSRFSRLLYSYAKRKIFHFIRKRFIAGSANGMNQSAKRSWKLAKVSTHNPSRDTENFPITLPRGASRKAFSRARELFWLRTRT